MERLHTRLHTPNEFFRIRRLREGMRAWEELWRLLADGPPGSRTGRATMAETPYTVCSYPERPFMAVINTFAQDAVDRAEPLPSLPPMHSVATRRWPSL